MVVEAVRKRQEGEAAWMTMAVTTMLRLNSGEIRMAVLASVEAVILVDRIPASGYWDETVAAVVVPLEAQQGLHHSSQTTGVELNHQRSLVVVVLSSMRQMVVTMDPVSTEQWG